MHELAAGLRLHGHFCTHVARTAPMLESQFKSVDPREFNPI